MTESIALALPDRMDIASAEQLHVSLEAALAEGAAITLIGSAVAKIDTAGMQLLLGFFTESIRLHIDVSWSNPSSTIQEAVTFLNLNEQVCLTDTQLEA